MTAFELAVDLMKKMATGEVDPKAQVFTLRYDGRIRKTVGASRAFVNPTDETSGWMTQKGEMYSLEVVLI